MARGKQSSQLTPPHESEAEKCLVGSVLLSADAFFDVVPLVNSDSFGSPANRAVWNAARSMYESGRVGVDIVLLKDAIKASGQLEEIGGEKYLLELLQIVPHAAHAEYYARIVRDAYVKRRVMQAAEEMIRETTANIDADELTSVCEQKIGEISESLTSAEVPAIGERMDATIQAIFDRIDKPGASTGFANLDDVVDGFQEDHLIVLAARPAMGKTATACSFARKAASRGPVAVFSLEMSAMELNERLLCMEAGVDGKKLRRGDLEEFEHHDLNAAASVLTRLPIFIDEHPGLRVSQIVAKSRRLKRKHKTLSLIIIDYLQLVEADDPSLPREQQVSYVTRKLKGLAKTLHVPVIALAQLNRGVESREDKRPRLSDLRESGAIEQDADIVLFLHRPDAYDTTDRPNEIDVIVAKNRHGDIGTATLMWQRSTMRFTDKSEYQAEQF